MDCSGKRRKRDEVEQREYEKQRKRRWRMESGCSIKKQLVSRQTIPPLSAQKIASLLVKCFKDHSKYMEVESKQEILREFIMDKAIADYTPDEFKEAEVKTYLVENLKASIQETKLSTSYDSMGARKSALAMAIGSSSTEQPVSDRALGKALDIHPRMIVAAKANRGSIDCKKIGWIEYKRSRSYDALSSEVVDLVEKFWIDNTRVSPNAKDVRYRRIERNIKEEHATHYLEESQSSMFQRFKEHYPSIKIKQRAFEKIKPWFVVRLKELNTCCCIHHVRLQMLLEGFNKIRSKHDKSCSCKCSICHCSLIDFCDAKSRVFYSTTDLYQSMLCPKEDDQEFHRRDCIHRTCSACGIFKFVLCPYELNNDLEISWEYWDYEEAGMDKKGKPKKRLQHQYKNTNASVLVEKLLDRLEKFPLHNFAYKWQAKQFREMLENIPRDTIISVVDFAENFTIQGQNQVQSAYWSNKQVSILVHITYFLDVESGEVVKETHYYISDDLKHDTLFVQQCFMMHHKFMMEHGIDPQRHWVFSDGAASQFKAARPFYFIGRYSVQTLIRMMWNFFGSAHGKGEHDGKAAELKRWLRELIKMLAGLKVECARDVVEIATERFSVAAPTSSSKTRTVKRYFWEVKDVDRSKEWAAATIEDTRKTHSVYGFDMKNSTHLHTRNFSCFCAYCIDEQWDKCVNKAYVDEWKLVVVQPTQAINDDDEVRRSGRTLYSSKGDQLSETLCVGDNFAVVAPKDNNEGADFWLMKCTKAKYVIDTPFQVNGQWFLRGESVLEGIYYRKIPTGRSSYALCSKESRAIVYATQICAVRLRMPQAKHKVKGYQAVYTLNTADSERIMANLPDVASDEE